MCLGSRFHQVLLHYFSADGWESWAAAQRPVIPERMPVLIEDDFRFEDERGPRPTRAVNSWLRTLPTTGAPSPASWKVYAGAARDWLVHLDRYGLSPFSDRVDLVAALGVYADRRLSGSLDQRIGTSTWNLHMTALTGFYAWAVTEGLTSSTPFTMTTALRMVDERLIEIPKNAAMLRRLKPHVRIKYLEADFAELFCWALAGLGPDGLEDRRFRGWFPGRNSAIARLALSSGLRRQEFAHLLVYELPPLPAQATKVPIPLPVPGPIAKGRKARTTWIDYSDLAVVHNYVRLERPYAAAEACWRSDKPLVVEEPDLFGARINGRRMRWNALKPAERLRLVDADGSSCLIALTGNGGPFTDWNTLFARTAERIRDRFEPRFPDVSPHRLRHSFAMRTLERLVSGYYHRAAEVVAAAGNDASLALYLTKADPLMILRDLLGHTSVNTTESYLKRLDVDRIYEAAYERAGRAFGLGTDDFDAELEAEFDDEGVVP